MPEAVVAIITKRSRHSYPQTLEILKKAIADAGNTVFAAIDQSAAAAGVGLTLRPTTLLVFGNPKGGTPMMDAFPLVALELPLKLLDLGGRRRRQRCVRADVGDRRALRRDRYGYAG